MPGNVSHAILQDDEVNIKDTLLGKVDGKTDTSNQSGIPNGGRLHA